ncbi:hypothetical protein TNCV_553501 [Trichonephila clavipes]|nr:hypothetical protein TNCV_553501 [Trichonephila clavipes]
MPSHNRLDGSLRWSGIGRFEACQSQAEALNGYKWPENGFPVVKSIPNKWYCHQDSRSRSPQSINIFTE